MYFSAPLGRHRKSRREVGLVDGPVEALLLLLLLLSRLVGEVVPTSSSHAPPNSPFFIERLKRFLLGVASHRSIKFSITLSGVLSETAFGAVQIGGLAGQSAETTFLLVAKAESCKVRTLHKRGWALESASSSTGT
jgi:hypothetical protein